MKPFNTKDRLLRELKEVTTNQKVNIEDVANLKSTIEGLADEHYKDCHWRIAWDDEDGLHLTTYDIVMMAYCGIYFADGRIQASGGTDSCGVCLDYEDRNCDIDPRSFGTDEWPYSADGVKLLLEQWHEFRVSLYKTFFCDILRLTQRRGIENVLKELDEVGFFCAPAGTTGHHSSYPGGLLIHSVKVYRLAQDMALKVTGYSEGIEFDEEHERKTEYFGVSLEIAALLHDVCKARRYVRNADGTYSKQYGTSIGHGEGSVIALLNWGLEMTYEEQLAIRYHMAGFDVSFNKEAQGELSYAMANCPLVGIIQAADTLSSTCLE